MSSLYLVLYAEPVGLTLDLEDYHPSVLLHCWMGHLTCKIVSEMTYNVSSGMLNPTIPYQAITSHLRLQLKMMVYALCNLFLVFT